jgi:restriction endonuclease S subunit
VNERIIDSKFHNPKFKQIVDFISSKFETIELRKIADIEYGYMPMQDYETNPEKGIPLIRVTNITQELEIKLDDLKYIPNWVKIPTKKFVEQGDILIVQCGDTTGKVGYIYEEINNHLFPSFCFSIKVKDPRIDSLFLAALLKTEILQVLFDQTVMINTVRPNTTKPRFEKMVIPIFDMKYQLEITDFLLRSNQAKKESKELIQNAKNQVEEVIKQSIQANV